EVAAGMRRHGPQRQRVEVADRDVPPLGRDRAAEVVAGFGQRDDAGVGVEITGAGDHDRLRLGDAAVAAVVGVAAHDQVSGQRVGHVEVEGAAGVYVHGAQ